MSPYYKNIIKDIEDLAEIAESLDVKFKTVRKDEMEFEDDFRIEVLERFQNKIVNKAKELIFTGQG